MMTVTMEEGHWTLAFSPNPAELGHWTLALSPNPAEVYMHGGLGGRLTLDTPLGGAAGPPSGLISQFTGK